MISKSHHISEYLRKKRVAAGLTQSHVAKSLGYSTAQFVSNWERGLSLPPVAKLGRIVDLYKLDSHELVQLIVDEQKRQLLQQVGRRRRN